MKKKILFFSCEPGGAEVLIPVVKLVRKQDEFDVRVVGYGHALDRFSRKEVVCEEISPIQKNDPLLLDFYEPDMLITSATSLPSVDMSEKYLWRQAKQRGILSLAFLDQWQNYAVRFSGVSATERLSYLPDYINCINNIGEREMIEEGFNPQILVKLGQPYLSSLITDSKFIDIHEVKNRLRIHPDQRVVLFISEAIREHYGRSRGYDQYDAFRLFLELMLNASQETALLVKLHPKDSSEGYEEVLSGYPNLHLRIIKNELSPIESILISGDVYGMTSIMLVEAYILGKKTTSLQPGLASEDACVLSRHSMIPVITSNNYTIKKRLARSEKISEKNDFNFIFQRDGFIQFMNHLMFCQGH